MHCSGEQFSETNYFISVFNPNRIFWFLSVAQENKYCESFVVVHSARLPSKA